MKQLNFLPVINGASHRALLALQSSTMGPPRSATPASWRSYGGYFLEQDTSPASGALIHLMVVVEYRAALWIRERHQSMSGDRGHSWRHDVLMSSSSFARGLCWGQATWGKHYISSYLRQHCHLGIFHIFFESEEKYTITKKTSDTKRLHARRNMKM